KNLVWNQKRLYTSTPALYQLDCKASGFEWVVENASDVSVFAWIRHGENGAAPVLVVSNLTPVERTDYRIGVPQAGRWIEKLNTDSAHYGGGGRGNLGSVVSDRVAAYGREHSLNLTLPPLTTLFFELERE
ncbi:MAG: alpha amylase C-terminal domain-containing protein, partial [Paracoccaceae bacterium]